MSSPKKASALETTGKRRFVLLRGGLAEDAPSARDREWQSFCERIGWQGGGTPLPSDYEDRLAARIVEHYESENVFAIRPRDPVGVASAAGAEWSAGETDESSPVSRRWRKGSVAVVALLCFVAASVASIAADRSVAPSLLRDSVEQTPAMAPVPSEAPADPQRIGPREERDPESEEAIPSEAIPPGSVALERKRRGTYRQVARTANARGNAHREERPFVAEVAVSEPRPVVALEEAEAASPPEVEGAAPPTGPRVDSAFNRTAFAAPPYMPGRLRDPSKMDLSLSGSTKRWYGVSFPDTREPASLPPGIGVVAQVDVAKAVGAF